MSKYDKMAKCDEDVHGYLQRMIENAAQKGIMITALFVNTPCIDRGCDVLTEYGHRHIEMVISSCAKMGLKCISLAEEDLDEFDC